MGKNYSPKTKQSREFHTKKDLGQNFLTDAFAIDEIVEKSGITAEDLVIEIGPGQGALTTELAEAAKHVIAIELDRTIIPILRTNLLARDLLEKVDIVSEDILKVDLAALIREAGYQTAKVIGNLPYYITTPVVEMLLRGHYPISTIIVMMQKEAADRVLAEPGSKQYGILSIEAQYFTEISRILEVDRSSFTPSPNVDSSVLKLDFTEKPNVTPKSEEDFFRVVKAGLAERRKTLRNALMLLELEKEETDLLLNRAGIDGTRRAESLTLPEFAKLADCYTEHKQNK